MDHTPPPRPGAWPSPISAADAVRGRRALSACAFAGDEVWWSEGRPDEGGRVVICARAADGSGPVRDLLPAPWNARTRVHEYGGVSFLAVPGTPGGAAHDLVFVEFTDQRLYRLRPGADPDPLVPGPDRPTGLRWADLSLDAGRNRIVAVREQHHGDGTYRTVRRSVVAIPLDGSAADNPSAITELAAGADFYGAPRLSADGDRLVYVCWNHPHMPWDGSELHLVELDTGMDRVIAGGDGISVTDPGFLASGPDAGAVLAMSDEHGWWRPELIGPDGGGRRWLSELDAEFAGPAWTLGARRWAQLPDARLVVTASGAPGVLQDDGSVVPLDPAWTSCSDVHADGAGRLAVVAGGDTVTARVAVLTPAGTGWHVTDLRLAADQDSDTPAPFRPPARPITVDGVHAVVYPPTNPEYRAEPGTAPYLMVVHGGPTSQFSRLPSATTAFFTSRGIGVVALDYGGSTGYGRAYRERLRHAWGRVDVADAATVARALVADGTAAPGSVVIEGGSAGGWTVLSALTAAEEVLGGDSPFAAGISLFGVADARALADGTHDFEARYTDSLLGPDPEAWFAASPLAHTARLSRPVLLLQGGKDPVVTPDQAEAFRAAAAERGVPHALVVFPEESHGFRAAAAQIATLETELGFLGQILGFDTPGVPRLDLVTA
jgi:dipeptidyl aminopeptidase/acylaminoacyl peptidase